MTNLDDLKKAWQAQSGPSEARFDEIVSNTRNASGLLQTTIYHRDIRESVAGIVVFLFFFPGLFVARNWVSWSGFAIESVVGLTLPIVLWRARKRPPDDASATFLDFVDVEVDFLRRQIELLRTVTWWYLLPIYIGIVLISLGVTGPRPSTIEAVFITVYLLACAVFVLFVWHLNRKGRKTNLEPLLAYYIQMKVAIEGGDEFTLPPPDPPAGFLEQDPRPPLTRMSRWIWSIAIVAATVIVAGLGYAIADRFDARTGGFIMSTAPVVGLLLFFISGIWRRNPRKPELRAHNAGETANEP